jgi:hypothetical protein
MKLIVLSGWSESGKDTVADLLVKNAAFTKYAIADPLKDLCASLYGFPRDLANTQEGKKTVWRVGYKTKTIRDLLLDTAKTDRSRFGDDIYIKETLQKIQNEGKDRIVISDLRYMTELTAIQKFARNNVHWLEIWKVVRDGQETSPVDDVSEYGLTSLQPDWIIQNDGTSIETLAQKVSEALNRKRTKNELSTSQNEDDGCSIM